jgi:DNA-binding GntR family transcriptional regulator
MEGKKTLHDYLYENLKEQILTGYYKYGGTLPSMNQLCETYHVGIRTVRDVLGELRDQGMIRTEERKPSVIVYRKPEKGDAGSDVLSVLQRKTSVLAVYETMEHVMPRLFACSVQACGTQTAMELFRHLKRSRRKEVYTRWKSSSNVLYNLLDASRNLLFRDIFTSLEIGARIPFFLEPEYRPPFPSCCSEYDDPMWMAQAVATGDIQVIQERFARMYRSLRHDIKLYLEWIESGIGTGNIEQKSSYSWNAERGRDHYYMQITRDLIDRIGLGIYPDGSFLPPEAALAREYGVSLATIRRSMSMLNRLGFCRTYNVKGTQVTLFNDQATLLSMKNKVHKKDTLLYLSGLQFMALASGPAALMAVPLIGKGEIGCMEQELAGPYAVPISILMRHIIAALPLEPYRIILQQVGSILHWGYYYSFYEEGIKACNELNQISHEAFLCLKAGKAEEFARLVPQCYCHALELVRDSMAVWGLSEAGLLVTPDESLRLAGGPGEGQQV